MPSITGTPQSFTFTTSGTTVTYTGGGATGADVYDVLCVNSDNTVATPSGWTLLTSRVVNQGTYIFARNGGTTTATIALGGGISTNTDVFWLRISGVAAVDTGASTATGVDASPGSASPALTTPALSSTAELVVAFAAAHNITGSPLTAYVWSSGYVEQINGGIGATSTGVAGSVAVKASAGTAAESPSVSWTNSANNRYFLVGAFTNAAGGTTLAVSGSASASPAAAGTLTLRSVVSGAAAATPTAAGALTLRMAVTGAAVTTPLASGSLTRLTPISGAAVVTPAAAGSLTLTSGGQIYAVAGTATVAPVAAGALTLQGGLAGAAVVNPVATGALTLRAVITGAAVVTPVAGGAIGLRALLAGSASVVPLALGSLSIIGPPGAITVRPFAGTTARPNSGVTTRP